MIELNLNQIIATCIGATIGAVLGNIGAYLIRKKGENDD